MSALQSKIDQSSLLMDSIGFFTVIHSLYTDQSSTIAPRQGVLASWKLGFGPAVKVS